MNKKIFIAFILLILLFCSSCKQDFSQVSEEYRDDLQTLWDKGFVDKYFFDQYQQNITRGEFCALLMSVYEYTCGSYTFHSITPFDDVAGHEYKEKITACYELGIIGGTDEGLFEPDSGLSYEQAAKTLCTLIGAIEYQDINALISDDPLPVEGTTKWAWGYIDFTMDLGLWQQQKFSPKDLVTRESALDAISRLVTVKSWQKPALPKSLKVPVLLYHMFSENPEDWNSMAVSPDQFESILIALKEAGYTTMLPGEFLNAYRRGTLPEKPILITIDDGYLSNYQYAYPLLQKYDMKATIFVIARLFDYNYDDYMYVNPSMFTAAQAREMIESGLVSIQPHSYNLHKQYPNKSPIGSYRLDGEPESAYIARLEEDFSNARFIVEKDLGDKVVSYSYPYGYHSSQSEKVLKDNGIVLSVTVTPGVTDVYKEGTSLMKRLTVTGDMEAGDVLALIESYMKN